MGVHLGDSELARVVDVREQDLRGRELRVALVELRLAPPIREESVDEGSQILQVYLSGSQIFGDYGDSSEVRAGQNWYFMKERGLRFNTEYIHVNKSPVGYTAYPMPVGANGALVAAGERIQ